jgi:hypothetical protein
VNTYAYVGDNPLTSVDIRGTQAIPAMIGLGVVAISVLNDMYGNSHMSTPNIILPPRSPIPGPFYLNACSAANPEELNTSRFITPNTPSLYSAPFPNSIPEFPDVPEMEEFPEAPEVE